MKVLFVAARLTDESRERLLRLVPPRHPTVFAEHMTLRFKPHRGDPALARLGETVRLTGISEWWDANGQALYIAQACGTANAHPHITISCAEGIMPKYSNEMLEGNAEARAITIELAARIEAQVANKSGLCWVTELDDVER